MRHETAKQAQSFLSEFGLTPSAATRVVVSETRISYVGSPPTVEKKDDLLVVKF